MSSARGRERILKVAEDLFVEKGFAGASMHEIAERAGIAKSLIYHHFPSKKALWHEIVRGYHERSGVLEKLYETISADDPAAIVQLVTGRNGFFEFFRKHPRLVRLFTWLDLDPEAEIDYPEEHLRLKVLERIREMQVEGLIRSDVEAGIIPVIFLALMLHWFSARRFLAPWMAGGSSGKSLDERFITGAMDIVMKGLAFDGKI
ncbi:TetR/AcrR family transcriptional regulator [Candidatus Fermentibacteria bacterium]|nr:TetR/AcrR family transcriptional regulator [Candidatus Fermentibacteria bacterium]